MTLSPIVLFTYNRPYHTRQTVEALQKNHLAQESQLFIYSDAPKNEETQEQVAKVREYLKTINGFKKINIIERNRNFGLANSIIDGVTKIVNEYGKIIVLEDDLITSPYFLQFMNEALELYENEKKVACIHGYIYSIKNLPETFFIKGADCWGWATWKRAWNVFEQDGKKLLKDIKQTNKQREADFNNSYAYVKMLKDQIKGKNNSWAIRWYISAFLKDMLTLYPGKSLIQNIGHDNQGTHCKNETDVFEVRLLNNKLNLYKINIEEDLKSRKKIEHFLNSIQQNLFQKVKSKFKMLIK